MISDLSPVLTTFTHKLLIAITELFSKIFFQTFVYIFSGNNAQIFIYIPRWVRDVNLWRSSGKVVKLLLDSDKYMTTSSKKIVMWTSTLRRKGINWKFLLKKITKFGALSLIFQTFPFFTRKVKLFESDSIWYKKDTED